MKSERKSKATRKSNRFSLGCLVAIGVMLGCAISFVLNLYQSFHGFGLSYRPEHELRLVMETYYFGDGLAHLTGNTSVLETVVTETYLQGMREYCNRGLCDGSIPPHVIGDHFKVVRETDEFAVVELSHRSLIVRLGEVRRGYLTRCYSLVRDGEHWRVSGGYLDCDGYLPDKYK